MTEILTPQRTFEPAPPQPPDTATPAAPRKVTVADVLERAAYRLEEDIDRWCQGGFATAPGEACASFAIALAEDDIGWRGPRWQNGPAYAALVKHLGLRGYAIPGWNDKPGRTKAEVISALRAAASSARTKEEA